MNTFANGKIFAQGMNGVNRELISEFFNREILNNLRIEQLPIIDAEIL